MEKLMIHAEYAGDDVPSTVKNAGFDGIAASFLHPETSFSAEFKRHAEQLGKVRALLPGSVFSLFDKINLPYIMLCGKSATEIMRP